MIGRTLGNYRITEQIGMGGMATVYKAYQPSMERTVALKVLPEHYARDRKFVQRFMQEAKVIARLEHPHILPVYDFGEEKGITYLAMRYLDGGTLKDVLALGRLTLGEAVIVLGQVAGALDYAHRQGVVHRDVKPSNVMLDVEGQAYLTDFGIAKVLETSAELTGSGAVLGTPAYMAPEQVLGKGVDGRADIYALGVMLYEMAVGRVPYQADTPMAVALAHVHLPLPLPGELEPGMPDAVQGVVLKALAKEPKDRYATAAEFAQALEGAVAASGVDRGAARLPKLASEARLSQALKRQTMDVPAAPEAQKTARRPWWIAAALAGIAVVAGIIGFALRGNLPFSGTQAAVQEAALVPSDPTPYDDFDDPAYEGAINTDRWTPPGTLDGTALQEDGALVMRQIQENSCMGVMTLDYAWFLLDTPTFFQADLMLGPALHNGGVHLGLATTPDAEGAIQEVQCGYNGEGGSYGIIDCWDRWNTAAYSTLNDPPQPEDTYNTPVRPAVELGTWHTVRIEADPATMTFTYYIDGRMVGSHTPARAEQLKTERFQLSLGVCQPTAEAVTGYIDNVHIGTFAP